MDFPDHAKGLDYLTDDRPLEELLKFINGNTGEEATENHEVKTSSKAAKRQRQKLKKVSSGQVRILKTCRGPKTRHVCRLR